MSAMEMESPKFPADVCVGSIVMYRGYRFKVMSVRLGDIAGPHFRVVPISECPNAISAAVKGLTSHRVFAANAPVSVEESK